MGLSRRQKAKLDRAISEWTPLDSHRAGVGDASSGPGFVQFWIDHGGEDRIRDIVGFSDAGFAEAVEHLMRPDRPPTVEDEWRRRSRAEAEAENRRMAWWYERLDGRSASLTLNVAAIVVVLAIRALLG